MSKNSRARFGVAVDNGGRMQQPPALLHSTLPTTTIVLNLRKYLAIISLMLIVSTLWSAYYINTNPHRIIQLPVGTSYEAFKEGQRKCVELKKRPIDYSGRERTNNPRREPDTQTILLKNGIILDGIGNKIQGDVVLKDGLVFAVGENLTVEDQYVRMIDVNKKFISPGLVDMHRHLKNMNHLGVDSLPELSGNADYNEETNPITPYFRTIDGLNPSDLAIPIIASGGITTSLVLPGSANVIGGEAYAIKLRPVKTLSVEDMLVNAHLDSENEKSWRWMKMACGENPKTVYDKSRMGQGWLLRKVIFEAATLKRKQDDWCDSADKIGSGEQLNTRFPEDLAYEPLVALLRGDVKLNVHCYETYDIEALIRHSLEFDFPIAAVHHALDAYRIPDIVKRAKNQITIATFSDLWGYKKEAFQASTKGPKILADAGIPVALKSDHPVTNAQHLAYEAAKSHHYGLDENLALAAVTSVPAKALGLDHRIGRIAAGYDADLVVWDSHPLSLGAAPLEVYIDGIPQFGTLNSVLSQPSKKKPLSKNSPNSEPIEQRKTRTASSVLIKNIGKVYLDENSELDAITSDSELISLFVKEGIIECLGVSCNDETVSNTIDVIDLNGGYVLPGITAVCSDLGLAEIISEDTANDGNVLSLSHPNDTDHLVYAIDGLKFGGRHLEEAYKAGILSAVTPPLSSEGVVNGISVAFKTGGIIVIDDEDNVVIKEHVALHFKIGNYFLDDKITTVSSQISFLRQVFISNIKSPSTNIYGRAARGEIPVAIYTNNKDEIATLIRLKKQVFRQGGKLRLVIVGGAEAHLLAEKLSENDIPVVLLPPRPTPGLWTAQHVLTGPPLTNTTAIEILHANNVLLGIGVDDSGLARNLVWDAGWVLKDSGGEISEKEAVGFITWNLAKIFGLKKDSDYEDNNVTTTSINGLTKGTLAEFVAYDGNPFDMKTRVRVVAGGGRKNVLIDPVPS
ncbi:8979_t:CDS:10 [Ambispora gerdemannii]|uniref:8979_t:CDS:1 n=1 Tax=Ambispora gerdemannii TaxID=144530 RepID=A0A9N8VUU9_9GLOM|nr:8979_t:CDS:10 [Ambispora gerdemannii]